MTLVVSEISRLGILMIGDSAITFSQTGLPTVVINGAAKIHYSEKANIGFAMWGNAFVRGQQLDLWLKTFIDTTIIANEDIEIVGQRLTKQIRIELEQEHKPWSDLIFGIHIAGYKDGLPRLWHIHCGHSNEPDHEPRLYHDFFEDKWSEDYFRATFFPPGGGGTASAHLRNGYAPYYGLLFDSLIGYSNNLRGILGTELPTDTLEGHLQYHKILVKFVAGALVAAGIHPGVNDNLSSISFNQDGIITDNRFDVVNWSGNVPQGQFEDFQITI